MAYAVLRCKKVKENEVQKLHNHNFRVYSNKSAENVNFEKTKEIIVLGSKYTKEKIKENLKKLKSNKAIRKDANVLLEFIFSASPEFFYKDLDKQMFDAATMKDHSDFIGALEINEKNLELFKKSVVDFIESKPEFKDNVVNLVLHMDEKTPHFHLTLTPIIDGRLTAKEFFTPNNARKWQTDFHSSLALNGLNLERGKEDSTSVHQTLQEYREGLSEAPAEAFGTPETEQEFKDYFEKSKEAFSIAKKAIRESASLKKRQEILTKKLRRFEENELEGLRRIPLLEVARKLGIEVKKEGYDFVRFRDERMNLVINTVENSFAENKMDVKGFGAINFLTSIFRFDFREAVDFLCNDFKIDGIVKEIVHTPKLSEPLVKWAIKKENSAIPTKKEENSKNVYNYLTKKRFIDSDIVKHLMNSGRLFADGFNNCVFVDKAENPKFATIRGTHHEKRFVASKGEMNFLKYRRGEDKNIYMFESVIDLLSFMTLYPNLKGQFVSIQGSAMSGRLDELNLQNYGEVFCCFDNDEQGKVFTSKVTELAKNAKVIKPKGKDFNVDLVDSHLPKPTAPDLSLKTTAIVNKKSPSRGL